MEQLNANKFINQLITTNQRDMKLTKTLMCASAAALMAIVSNEAQAVVINNALYVPLNFKGTYAYVVAGAKIKTATFTSKQIVNYLGANYYTTPSGTQLAVGPDQDIYLVTKTTVIADLSADGFMYISNDILIDTEVNNANGSYKYIEAGLTSLTFYSDDEQGEFITDNEYYFSLTGNYSYTENGSAVKNGYYNQSSSFNTKNLGGEGYNFKITESELPVSGSASGSASGKLPD